jgi:hypothetical protein
MQRKNRKTLTLHRKNRRKNHHKKIREMFQMMVERDLQHQKRCLLVIQLFSRLIIREKAFHKK